MAFEFKVGEPVDHDVRRIAGHQIARILRDLGGSRRVGRDKVVHSGRKRLKRVCAMLRLLRGTMRRKILRRENEVLRDAGRALSGQRDADALVAALDELLRHCGGGFSARAFANVRVLLLAKRRQARTAARTAFRPLLGRLRAMKSRLSKWSFDEKGWSAIEGGLCRTYRDGRRA